MSYNPKIERIGIIGGGIAGLTAAWYASARGARISLFESSDQLGGLGKTFDYNGNPIEKFYHCMLPSDTALLSLLDELGMSDEIYWKDSSFGLINNGELFALNNPVDLLRFKPLPVVDRLRVGLTGLWGTVCSDKGLDDISCKTWLTRLSGQRAFETFWKPMLQAKFGDRYDDVPALWFWKRFNREKGAKKERKGYINGGYRRIADVLANSLQERGVKIQLKQNIKKIDLSCEKSPRVIDGNGMEHQFDRIIYAGPIAMLEPLIDGNPALRQLQPIDMQGVINAVMMFKRSFTPHYWVATVDSDIPFQGIVESSTLLNQSDTAGTNLVYLMNYVHKTDPLFQQTDEQIKASYIQGMKRLFPELTDDDLIDAFVFRSPLVEPIYTTGYQKKIPPIELIDRRLYLATTAQVYPDVTSWNGSTHLAKRVIEQLFDSVNHESASKAATTI